ncbi:MAG: helix-turn-helix domain-containing protein, partial [Planctomycetota bacterium]
ATRLGREPLALEAGARELFLAHPWPGNVRELHNLVTRASVLADGPTLSADAVRGWLRRDAAQPTTESETPATISIDDAATHASEVESLADVERRVILATLGRFDGHRQKTADALGIGVRTLSGKLRAYGVPPGEKGVPATERTTPRAA